MTSLFVDTPTTALEDVQRAAFTVLFKTFNETLAAIETVRNESDESFATMTGRPYVATTLEQIEPDNFIEGHRPSLIGASVDKYPNVSVMAYRSTPGPGTEAFDHQEVYRVLLAIEVMVKASPEDGEEMCNRRAKRAVEAAHACMQANTTLGGIVSGFDGAPTSNITELFTRKERTAYGPHWFWQGGRLEYAVRKEASLPSHGTNFRSVIPDGLDFDQA